MASGTKAEPSDRLRVIVLGYIVRGPVAGMTWHHLQYVMGLEKLGHEVCFLEDSGDWAGCYDPCKGVVGDDPTYGLRFASHAFETAGIGDRWAYYDAGRSQWVGPRAEKAIELCKNADVLLDLSPMDPMRPWFLEIPVRVLIDTDPVFTQVTHIKDPSSRARALTHTAFFSFGENFGLTNCTVPDDGIPWLSTRQPIVAEAWPITPGPINGRFTTVMLWNSYPSVEHAGCLYGTKAESFAPYMNLPDRVGPFFELAVGSPSAPRASLCEKGWFLRDPLKVSKSLETYQEYIQQSKAEFSVAKHGYVVTRSGWFSERSAAYLASGRPVLVQDTGFSTWLPTGSGVLSFRSPDEILASLKEINNRYLFHQRMAREIAKEYFDSGKVLSNLLLRAISFTGHDIGGTSD